MKEYAGPVADLMDEGVPYKLAVEHHKMALKLEGTPIPGEVKTGTEAKEADLEKAGKRGAHPKSRKAAKKGAEPKQELRPGEDPNDLGRILAEAAAKEGLLK